MSQNSLFAILLRSPWWVSFVVAGLIGVGASVLVPDPYNPGELRVEPIYDSRVEWREAGTGKCWIDVHAGELLVDSSTAVYWR